MTLEEYMRELILMSRQYGQEEELYPLINMFLRENDNVKHLSVRDVHNKGSRGVRKKIFRGYASYPDLAIVSENLNLELAEDSLDLNELKKLYGCVEAKIFNPNYNNKEKDAENSNYIFSIPDDINAEWKLDYPYIFKFKTNGGSWSNGYYTNIRKKKVHYRVELDINKGKKSIKNMEFFSVATEKKAKLKFGKYEKYIICERTVRINKRTHKDIIQLLSELFLYGKLIYTDGLVWYYLELTESSKENICKKSKGLSDLLNNDDINDERKNRFIDAIEKIREIQVLSVEIGNLKEIFLKIQEDTNKTSLSCITEYLQKIESEKSEVKPNQEWNRLKYNLASINWFGSNTKEQFL